MKCSMIFALLCVMAAVCSANVSEEWKNHKGKHGKSYSAAEEALRFSIFKKTHDYIKKHNSAGHGYQLAHNVFSDYTAEEMARMRGAKRPETPSPSREVTYLAATERQLQPSLNYVTQGLVTPVKNQGNCGSCWAFSVTGVLEGAHYKKHQKLLSLSKQQLVSCDYTNYGCDGGWPSDALVYLKNVYGSYNETAYPYTSGNTGLSGTCNSISSTVAARVSSVVSLPSGNETALQLALVQYGPVSVCIDASQDSFQFYSSGVYNEPNCSNSIYSLDHAVLVVGYGTDSIKGDYWIVKNSWGTSWGINGYIWIARNAKNMCGIATEAVAAVAV